MTDREAIKLANLIGEYWAECRREGMRLDEVQNLTLREVIGDILQSMPTADAHLIGREARVLLNDPINPEEEERAARIEAGFAIDADEAEPSDD
jgi:hypothetical protein